MSFSPDRYLARQYDKRRYHCWHLVTDGWRDLTGEDLGPVPDWDDGAVLRQFSRYCRADRPVSPCIVLMLRPPGVPHAGLFIRGRVLHIRAEGARYERLEDATRGFAEVRFYAARDADPKPAGAGELGAG